MEDVRNGAATAWCTAAGSVAAPLSEVSDSMSVDNKQVNSGRRVFL
jgi:hypothetical protein